MAAFGLLLIAQNPAGAGTMARPTPPDPLLNPAPGPCAGLAAGPDYTAGTDAMGHPVIAADMDTRPVPVPDEISVPLTQKTQETRQAPQNSRTASAMPAQGGGAYAGLDGRKIAPLLEKPGCRPKPH